MANNLAFVAVRLTHLTSLFFNNTPSNLYTSKVLSQSAGARFLVNHVVPNQNPSKESLSASLRSFSQSHRVVTSTRSDGTSAVGSNGNKTTEDGGTPNQGIRGDLISMIDKQIQELQTKSTTPFHSFLKESNFQLAVDFEEGVINLKRDLLNQTVTATFNLPEVNDEENDTEPASDDVDVDVDIDVDVRIKATNSKGKEVRNLFAECLVHDQAFQIQRVKFTADQRSSLEFASLSDELKTRFQGYFHNLGLNEKAAQFIQQFYLTYKSRSKINNLLTVKNFLQHCSEEEITDSAFPVNKMATPLS